ncbi:MAG TPA: phage baseplate assembly protein V [Anaeromyxobacter sp.]|nr:phage baseplate assembly protein V [Anaeromyxobacter sp.]
MLGVTPFERMFDERLPSGLGGRFYGLYPALVSDLRDPDNQGRVKVTLPWSPDPAGGSYEVWARLATAMGGANRGLWAIPDVNTEVVVAFEGGDPRHPFVLGGLWNGRDAPPDSMDGAGKNARKVFRSRNGVKITLDDTDGQESLTLETPAGQKVVLQDGPGSIQASDSNGNSVRLESSGITVTSSAKVTVNASTAEISASMLTVNAGMSRFSGIVQADTVITNSVVSASYTPGAGNIW